MKNLFVIVAIAALAFGVSNASAHGNSGGSAAPAAHSSSASAPSAAGASHLSGGPHSFYGMPYRYSRGMYHPVVTYRNGNRVFIYSAVGPSTVHHSVHSGASNLNQTRALQRSGNRNLQHTGAVNITAKSRLALQTSARLRNWNGNVSTTAQAHQNHWNNCHHHHDHDWWHDHCIAFIFWDWGWWGWWDGWWYPAWGYDPYSYYAYNEPIYGYDGLSPEQIIASVQGALQELGYYTYAIDGQMGPLTRSAIARYQRDHRLPITSGIDPATLGSLEIIH